MIAKPAVCVCLLLGAGVLAGGESIVLNTPGGEIRGELLKVTDNEVIVKDHNGHEQKVPARLLTAKDVFNCKFLSLNPTDAKGFYELGVAALKKNLRDEAVTAFNRAEKIEPALLDKIKAALASGSADTAGKKPAATISAATVEPPKKISPQEALRQRILEAGKARDFPECAWDKRLLRDTQHYHIEANVPEETTKYVMLMMEELYAFYSQRLNNAPREKLTVYVFATRKDFEQQARAAGFPVRPNVGGFYTNYPIAKMCAIYMPWIVQGEMEPSSVLMHEGFHQFYHRTNHTSEPVWLNEGMAVYFENCKFDGEKLTDAYISPRVQYLQRQLEEGKYDKLDKLMNISHANFLAPQYGEAWSLLYFLAWGKEPAKRKEFQQRLELFLRPEVLKDSKNHTVEAFERVTGLKLAEVEPEWKKWVLSLDPNDPYGGKGDPRKMK